MMTRNRNNRRQGWSYNRGFTLVELLVVVAILGVLAAAVGVYINNIDARLRSFAFNLGSRFKQAKFEAMNRGHDVYLDFNLDLDGNGVVDSYALWVNNNDDSPVAYNAWTSLLDANANGVCDENEGDCLIGDRVDFEPGVEVYDASDPNVAKYPGNPKGGPAAGPHSLVIGDGLTAANDRFRFAPSGDSQAGSIYLYAPRPVPGGKQVAAGPLSITVNTVGRIVVDEWRFGKWKKD